MFDSNSGVIINWFEKLEEKAHQLIFNKSNTWFQNPLDMSDVENYFLSIVKVYKSGKYYLVRANVKNSSTNEPHIKIYDENEITLGITDINNETNIISILEIQGIKFTPRNFQIEIEIKQVMVINSDPIFKNCMIRNAYKVEDKKNASNLPSPESQEKEKEEEEDEQEEELEKENEKEKEKEEEKENKEDEEEEEEVAASLEEPTTTDLPQKDENNNIKLEVEEVVERNDDDILGLEVVDISCLDSTDLESVSLRKPNQVYFEIYKEAKNKARLAKKAAIIAYLEAKNIKKTYMIERINDSDSDFDAEIEDVSESELEGL
jgi:hypothetical protein